MTLRSGRELHGWQETPAENLCLRTDLLVGEGWSGYVARGTFEGHPVAVKLAPLRSGHAEALHNEVMAYRNWRRIGEGMCRFCDHTEQLQAVVLSTSQPSSSTVLHLDMKH